MTSIILKSLNDDDSNIKIEDGISDSGNDGAIEQQIDHLLNSIGPDKHNNNNNGDIWDHQITFEIPSNLDLERIKSLDNFTSLLNRIPRIRNDGGYNGANGGVGGVITGSGSGSIYDEVDPVNFPNIFNSDTIEHNSVLGKWSNTNSDTSDYQVVLNYLWLGVVTSLIIMSIVFIVFSCYFYRKFREWKKCNKDIRSQLPHDLYPPHGNNSLNRASCMENGYYQMMESPPCYTIATGLPSYDEALIQAHAQQHQQQHQQHFIFDARLMTSWEKPHVISESNYLWDDGNTFETTNLVVTTNLTDITTMNNSQNNNNNNNSNDISLTNIVKEIENLPNSTLEGNAIITNFNHLDDSNSTTTTIANTNTNTPLRSLEYNLNMNLDRRNRNEEKNERNEEKVECDDNDECKEQKINVNQERNELNFKDNECTEIVVMS